MRIATSKVPLVLALGAALAAGACGGDAESAADDRSVRVIPAETAVEAGSPLHGDPAAGSVPDGSEAADEAAEGAGTPPRGSAVPPGDGGASTEGRDRVAGSEGRAGTGSAGTTRRPEPRPYQPSTMRTDPEPAPVPENTRMRPEAAAVPVGTVLEFRMETELSTRFNRAGEIYHATLTDDFLGQGGVVLLPAGALLTGRIVSARASEGADQPAAFVLDVQSVEMDGRTLPVYGRVVDVEMEADSRDSAKETAVKVGAGAAAGALLGKIIGKDNKDAVKGGVVGAVAGTAVAMVTRDGHATIEKGAKLVVRLDERLIVDG